MPADARDEAARLQLRIQGNALQAQRDELAAHALPNDEIGYELTGLGRDTSAGWTTRTRRTGPTC